MRGPTFDWESDIGWSDSDVKIKSIPSMENKLCILAVYNICIQMKQKELTKTFTMISNWKIPFGLHGSCKNIWRLQGLTKTFI